MKKETIAVIILTVLAACSIGGWNYYEAGIQKMRDKGVADLNASVNLDDYREAEQAQIQTILEEGAGKIAVTKDQEVIDKVISDAGAQIGKLKTDAQYTAEEEEARRQAELERQRREEEERRAAEAAAAAAAAAQSSSKSSGSSGCVGGSSDNFY